MRDYWPGFPARSAHQTGLTCCVCCCTVCPGCQAALLPASSPRCDVPRQTGSVCRGLGPRSSRPPPGQQPRHLPAPPGQHSARCCSAAVCVVYTHCVLYWCWRWIQLECTIPAGGPHAPELPCLPACCSTAGPPACLPPPNSHSDKISNLAFVPIAWKLSNYMFLSMKNGFCVDCNMWYLF